MKKGTQTISQKHLFFKPTFKISHYAEQQQKFFTLFNFQHSQITQNEFEILADIPFKYPSVYATSKFDVGKNKFTTTFTLET